jgi:hypothetical protein
VVPSRYGVFNALRTYALSVSASRRLLVLSCSCAPQSAGFVIPDGIDPDRQAAAIEANRSKALRVQTSDNPDPYRHMRPYPASPRQVLNELAGASA